MDDKLGTSLGIGPNPLPSSPRSKASNQPLRVNILAQLIHSEVSFSEFKLIKVISMALSHNPEIPGLVSVCRVKYIIKKTGRKTTAQE